MQTEGAFSNGIITLTKALGNISISGIPTESDMQSIAEEVVSSSGGGGAYITSGFSNYVGHSAIGFGDGDIDTDNFYEGIGIGVISSRYIRGSTYTIIDGTIYGKEMNAIQGWKIQTGYITGLVCALVF